MQKIELVERAKTYMKMLGSGVHPLTGEDISSDSALSDERMKRCFEFITTVLDEYIEIATAEAEAKAERQPIVIPQKLKFYITREQSEKIRLSKKPISTTTFMRNINAVIDSKTTEKLTSTRVNEWLRTRGLITAEKVPTVVHKTVHKPSELATRLGIVEEESVNKKSGEVKTQIKFGECAQLFIIENLEDIISTT